MNLLEGGAHWLGHPSFFGGLTPPVPAPNVTAFEVNQPFSIQNTLVFSCPECFLHNDVTFAGVAEQMWPIYPAKWSPIDSSDLSDQGGLSFWRHLGTFL